MRRLLLTLAAIAATTAPILAAQEGSHPYSHFRPDTTCASCHVQLAAQQRLHLMSASFTHKWDEVEYFRLALPHSGKLEKVAGIKAGCNGCHAPLAFLAGDIPPKKPAEGSRANEGVSCHLCHSITGFEGDTPFNFNFVVDPEGPMQGTRDVEGPGHEVKVNPFLKTPEFCGTCHNEQDPYGVWVKATHLEWKESPYAKAGIRCQDCHMPPAKGTAAEGAPTRPDVRQHTFPGAHDRSKLVGSVEVRVEPQRERVKAGETLVVAATVMNAKAGHMIPSGSSEERVVWLHVEMVDANGKRWHLKVDRKGFKGEEFTIADPNALAYQDLGEIEGIKDFKGLKRDGDVPAGDRIFRLPFLDPQGRMTIAQWHTASQGPDYRLPPLKAVRETFTWKLPQDIAKGEATVTATVWYQLVVSSVARHLGLPPEEYRPVPVARHSATFIIE